MGNKVSLCGQVLAELVLHYISQGLTTEKDINDIFKLFIDDGILSKYAVIGCLRRMEDLGIIVNKSDGTTKKLQIIKAPSDLESFDEAKNKFDGIMKERAIAMLEKGKNVLKGHDNKSVEPEIITTVVQPQEETIRKKRGRKKKNGEVNDDKKVGSDFLFLESDGVYKSICEVKTLGAEISIKSNGLIEVEVSKDDHGTIKFIITGTTK